MPSDIDYGAV